MIEILSSSKRFLILALLFSIFNTGLAQINFSQNFNTSTSTLPSGWTTSGYTSSTTTPCEGTRSPRGLLTTSSTSNSLTAPNQFNASNGNDISVSFTYKIINQTGGGATPANFGSLEVLYSTNGGTNYTSAHIINNSNHTPSTSCASVNFTIPGTSVPNGNSFRLRFQGAWTSGSYYVYIDDIVVIQSTGSVPNCNANLTSPTSGSTNVPVSTANLNWSSATGNPTGYILRVGTAPGASNIINSVDVGNVNTYPISLNYSTTYYVGITPYNLIGNATGCTEQTFSTAAPITTGIPWSEEFATMTLPNGWDNNGFTVATSTRLPDAESNVIFKNLNSVATTGNFSTISAGEVQAGNQLSFIYRLANFASPYNPPAASSGNFIVSISTDHGLTYSNIETIVNNGLAGWQNYELDLSAYEGEFVRVKITANRTSGDYYIGFDNFYIGEVITCEIPEDIVLDFVGNDTAQISWGAVPNAPNYNWFVFNAGADPENDTPLFTGSVSLPFAEITGLLPSTDYDFYVQADCGATDGLSLLSEVLSFSTLCDTITSFPFTETFEDDSSSRDCWGTEYVTGTINWTLNSGAEDGSITAAHSGELNALFYFASYAPDKSKLVSPSFDIVEMLQPKLTFWYANEEGLEPGDQNELRVYYKTSVNGTWTLIPGAVYNSNINAWTLVDLDLPEASDDYYIAFEGTNSFGMGIVVDDITIMDLGNCPVTEWDGFAWSNGDPNLNKKAIINGNLILSSDLQACELEITENGNLEISSGFNFTVKGIITNNASGQNLVVTSGSNLIQIDDVDNTGEITVIRQSQPFKRLDYTMWSSPVAGQQLQAFSPMTLPNRIYVYEGISEYVPTSVTANFIEAKGYLFRAPNDWGTTPASYTGTFTGVPFNGTVYVGAHSGSYTSIGNPYPSNIDADELMAANPGISTLYFWTNTNPVVGTSYSGNNYATYTFMGGAGTSGAENNESNIPNGIISVGQGFIVGTTDNSVMFNNEMRTADNTTFFKNENLVERHRYWLNFKNANDNPYNQILVGYMTGATNGVDSQIDGRLFGYSGSALYSVIDGEKYVIQGRALPFQSSDVVQLGVRIIEAGEFVINIANMDGLFAEGQTIYLHDKYLDIVHNLSEGSYSFHAEAGEFNDRFDAIYEEPTTCPSTTIWNGLAWNNGVPDSDKKAVINGDLTLDTNLEACELQVNINGSIEIPAGLTFTVNGLIKNNATAQDFIVASGGNLIQVDDLENIGEITVMRESQPFKRLDYTMWSSPVAGQQLQDFSAMTLPNRIYTYDGLSGYTAVTNATDNFNEAKGYLFRAPNDWDTATPTPYMGKFTGIPFNGSVNIETYADNYTSIGNPYPSNIDADELMSLNDGISTLYYWTNVNPVEGETYSGNNYATYTNIGGTSASGGSIAPDNIISVGQGFIVATSENSVNFTNEMRVSDSGNFFKNEEKHRFWLNLGNVENMNFNQVLVGYMEGATSGIDNQIDGKMFAYEGSALYNIIDEQKFTIQGRALPFVNSDVVLLGFKAENSGKFKISLSNYDGLFLEGEVKIYLKDKMLDITHNLMESDYTFESASGEFKNRFEIVYLKEEILGTGDHNLSSVQIYRHNQNIVVESKTDKILSVELYDMTGSKLFEKEQINANIYSIRSIANGVLIIKVKTQDGKIVSKKIINR